MTTSQEIKNTLGEITETALILATTCSAALGPQGIPLAIFFGTQAGLVAIFSPAYEPSSALTEERLNLFIEKAVRNLTAVIHKTAANTASSRIKTVYAWYRGINERVNGGEQFTAADLDELRDQVVDQLGGNSNLELGMNELSNRDIGKYVMPMFALGAILGVKVRLYDIAQQQARGEQVTSGQMEMVSRYADEKANSLRDLIRAADFELGVQLEAWKKENPGSTNAQWLQQRDRIAQIMWGGPAGLDLLSDFALEMNRLSANAGRIASEIRKHVTPPPAAAN